MYTVHRNNGWNKNIVGEWVVVAPDGLAVCGFWSFRAAVEDAAYLNGESD